MDNSLINLWLGERVTNNNLMLPQSYGYNTIELKDISFGQIFGATAA